MSSEIPTPTLLYKYNKVTNSIRPIEYTTIRAWKCPKDYVALRIEFNFRRATRGSVKSTYGRIYKNGVAVGKEWSYDLASPFRYVSEYIPDWRAGDTVEIRLRTPEGGGEVQSNALIIYGPSEPQKTECNSGEKKAGAVCVDGKWQTAPESMIVPAHGEKRKPTTCWDGSVIHAEKFDVTLKRWIPTGEICPTKPECIPGDKKAGYVCKNGKWIEYTPPESAIVPEPEVPIKYLTLEEAVTRHESGLPCYIKCTLPLFAMIPGLPWSPEMWVPPFCVIATKP